MTTHGNVHKDDTEEKLFTHIINAYSTRNYYMCVGVTQNSKQIQLVIIAVLADLVLNLSFQRAFVRTSYLWVKSITNSPFGILSNWGKVVYDYIFR